MTALIAHLWSDFMPLLLAGMVVNFEIAGIAIGLGLAFGLALAPTSGADGKGLAVTDIDPTGVAAQRGIKVGDVVLEVQGKSVASVADVTGAIRAAKADGRKAVLLRLKSQDGMRFVPLPLSAS